MLNELPNELLVKILQYLNHWELQGLNNTISNYKFQHAIDQALTDLQRTMCPGCFNNKSDQYSHMVLNGCLCDND